MADDKDLLTSTEAARLFGLHRDTTRRAAAFGQVPGARRVPRSGAIHDPWVASRAAWEQWYDGRLPAGRPRIKGLGGVSEQTLLTARIGTMVRDRRRELEWTQVELGRRAQLPAWVVGAIERGDRLPNEGQLGALSAALGIPIPDLIGDVPYPWQYWPKLFPYEV